MVLGFSILALYFAQKRKDKENQILEESKQELERIIEKRTAELRTEIMERKEAEESDKLKTAFLANMSHEIRTPMNAIISFANFLKENHLDLETKQQYIHYIETSGATLLRLIDDIIDSAKIEANQLIIKKEPVNINQLLIDLHNIMLKSNTITSKQGIAFVLDDQVPAHNYIVQTDKFRVKQVLTNLIENGFKYTDTGTVKMGMTIKYPHTITFYVQDTGIGIPEDKHHLVLSVLPVHTTPRSC
ncbi:MAG: hypothetical protein HC896_07830 [Bacteroidales bacterium]|nr:hypothetical protein [Bacteroidales bacterium]